MLLALNIPAVVIRPCRSQPYTLPSATAIQRHERYHLPLGCVNLYHSLYYSASPSPASPQVPSPSPSLSSARPQSPYLSPFSLLFLSLVKYYSDCALRPPHPRCCHCHYNLPQDSFHHSVLHSLPSSHHHHLCQLSHSNTVIWCPGSRLGCTAGSLLAQSLPCDHCYHTKTNTGKYVQSSPIWLAAD